MQLWLVWASCAWADEPAVRNRASLAVIGEGGQYTDDANLEAVVSEWLHAEVVDSDSVQAELRIAGRGAVRTVSEDSPLDRMRVRELGLHVHAGEWTVDIGRFSPDNGLYRLVDGVQALAAVGDGGLRIGAWAGTGADPYTTAPMLRYGGGPAIDWQSDRGQAGLFGEVLAFNGQLERVGAVVRGRYELSDAAEIGAHADVQGSGAGVRLVDGTVVGRFDAGDDVRIDVAWDAWSAAFLPLSEARDPTVTRFAVRSAALNGEIWVPQDAVDPTVYQMGSTGVLWRPKVGDSGTRALLGVDGRYRWHVQPERTYARAGFEAGLLGIAAGRLDLGVRQAGLWWGGTPGTETGLWAWFQLDDTGRLGLDASTDLVMKILDDQPGFSPAIYADTFVDWVPSRQWTLGVGGMFSNTRDLDRWDSWFAAMARVGWRFESGARE
ncbi:MAG: hypothetical protein ACI8PZ_004918 [Myxococcota bacterium]|jgi:hypothetical protein